MIDFLKRNVSKSPYLSEQLDFTTAFRHAVELVIIDGVCLGIDVTETEKLSIVHDCNTYLIKIIDQSFSRFSAVKIQRNEFINTVAHIGVTPFVLPK